MPRPYNADDWRCELRLARVQKLRALRQRVLDAREVHAVSLGLYRVIWGL